MSLEKYREKRTFDKTPEPAPGTHKSHSGDPRFCVQRHHASHLHYDFRLEVDGALKSWAVPKGPTLDPAEKRLAMMVEDHPLDYGSFEGVIPKGNYGAGSVMLWDRGTYKLLGDATAKEQLDRGDFKFHLTGEKLNGDFAIVRTKRGKGNEWLLLKKKDSAAQPGWNADDHARSVLSGLTQEEIAQGVRASPKTKQSGKKRQMPKGAVAASMPKHLTPMLAEIGRGAPPSGDDWLFEIKWDGVRALCYVENGRMKMVSRNGNLMDFQYPELSILPHHLNADNAIIDAEITLLDERGIPSFEALQKRINVAEASAVATLARHHPAVLYLFDVLYLDGHDLRGVELGQRKQLLQTILKPSPSIRYSDVFEGSGADLLEAAKQQGLEGIVAKRRHSFYESRRSSAWVKYKIHSSDSVVLCGFTKGERELFGALVLGIYENGILRWTGNVGTGFDRKLMLAIHAKLAPLAIKQCPLAPERDLPKKDVTWVSPELVCEVRYTNITNDGKLRAPVFVGLRPDIDPLDCVRTNATQDPVNAEMPTRDHLLSPTQAEAIVTVDDHRLKFTNLNKIFYPAEKYTKRDLLNYYDAVAPLLLPHLKDRPLSLKRYPNGIAEDFFFQKAVAASFPKWLKTGIADGIRYVIGDDRATLLFLVNLGCIDHNPWMSRMETLEHPDYVLIDLDPYHCGYDKIVEAALLVRKKLDLAELESYPKTTGGDGMHIVVPLKPEYTYEQVRTFAQLIAEMVTRERPGLFTTPRAISKREKGRVYFDWAQIAQGKTISAPYVLRAYPGAPVATPLAWREVTHKLDPKSFHIGNVLARFDRMGDLFAPVLTKPQTLDGALQKLSTLGS
ncbi:MAG: DNA ligase D [Acidobacteriota bacterium]